VISGTPVTGVAEATPAVVRQADVAHTTGRRWSDYPHRHGYNGQHHYQSTSCHLFLLFVSWTVNLGFNA
jgi:hypothetical protein